MTERQRKSRRKYPIRISLMTERACEMTFTVDRGKDTAGDHAFVEQLQRECVQWVARRRGAKQKGERRG